MIVFEWLTVFECFNVWPPTHPPTPIWPPPLKCSIPHSYLIRARSTAHSKIFLYKSFFKGLYYTLSHTYNAYTFFSIFLLSNMIYLFFFESYCVLYGAPKGTSVEKTYVISFPRNHFVRTKYVISFRSNEICYFVPSKSFRSNAICYFVPSKYHSPSWIHWVWVGTISFPRNHFVWTKYVISFPRNVIRHHEIYHIIIYYHIYISYIYISGHNLPDKSCVADTAMQIELA